MIIKHIACGAMILLCGLALLSGCSGDSSTQNGGERDTSVQGDNQSSVSTQQDSASAEQDSASAESKGKVSVYAGALMPGFEDGTNEKAQFIKPYGLCKTKTGEILIVDCYANLLRTSDGKEVVSIAGNTEILDLNGYPFGGSDNGPVEKALLNRPRFGTVTREGAVVFSDTGNNQIRILYKEQVSLLAGEGSSGFRNGGYGEARFDTPSGVAVDDKGVVYVADTLNHCIRAISPEGMVTTFAGIPEQEGYLDGPSPEALFCEPNDIELDMDGALYVVDKGNQRIRRIYEGKVTTVAGSGNEKDPATGYILGGYQDGEAAQAMFQYPTGISCYQGTLFVADTGNNCIRAISNGRVATVTGTKMSGNTDGDAREARFNQPIDVLCSNGALYISDSYNHVVRVVEWENGKIPTVFAKSVVEGVE